MVATEKNRTCIISDSHLTRINKGRFRTDEERRFVISKRFRSLKCFQGANTK